MGEGGCWCDLLIIFEIKWENNRKVYWLLVVKENEKLKIFLENSGMTPSSIKLSADCFSVVSLNVLLWTL